MESKVQSNILGVLEWAKAFSLKVISANKAGIPDTIYCLPITQEIANHLFQKQETIGLFVAIEVKREGNKKGATPLQLAQIRKIQKAGGIAFVSDNPEEVQQYLSQTLYNNN